MLDRYFVHPRLLKIFRYRDELCIFQIRRKLPPRTSSTEFSTIPTENSISYIRKGITNTSFSKKSFSTISRAHERLKFNIDSIPRKFRIERFTDEKKIALEHRREDQRYLSIRGLTEDEYQNAKSKCHLRRWCVVKARGDVVIVNSFLFTRR